MRHSVFAAARQGRSRGARRQSEIARDRLACRSRRTISTWPEATKRGIAVTVVPPIVAEATADIHFGLMLAVARRMVEGDRMVRAGKFPGSQSNHLAGAFVLRQDHRPGRRRRPHRPGHGAARARLRHAHPLLGSAPQARGRARDRHGIRDARPAAGGIRFRLAAFAAQCRDAAHDLRRANSR